MKFSVLKKKLKSLQTQPLTANYLRLHRAISWLKCAEEYEHEPDLQCISLWIAFNACYAVDEKTESSGYENEKFSDFIAKLVLKDSENRISRILWEKFSGPVRLIIDNPYIFKPFWDYQRGQHIDWEGLHRKSVEQANQLLSNNNVTGLLNLVLNRLYILRNQLIHGGATWKSKVNRSQVKDACSIMQALIPVIIDIMLDHPEADWGKVYYPVIESRVL